MYHSETYSPRLSDLDEKGMVSYEAMLQLLETAGGHHSDLAGDTVVSGSRRGIAWILTNWRLHLLRRIDGMEKLGITTWVRGKAGVPSVYRDFILTDKNGSEVMRAEAKFCLLDTNTGKLIRIGEELLGAYSPEDRRAFDDAVPRLHTPSSYTTEKSIPLRRSDVDFNAHVHNTRHIVLALEVLPLEVYAEADYSEIQIAYIRPITKADEVTARYARTDAGHFVGIYSNDILCAMVEFKRRYAAKEEKNEGLFNNSRDNTGGHRTCGSPVELHIKPSCRAE